MALSRELRLQMNSEVLNPKRQQELAWEIVQLNKGLAFRFLKRRCRQINVDLMDEDDIEQESRLLLLQAVNLWDPERGSLSAILNYVVLNALRDVPGRVGIRVPSNLRSGIRSAERVLWQEQAKGNFPSFQSAVSNVLGYAVLPGIENEEALATARWACSLQRVSPKKLPTEDAHHHVLEILGVEDPYPELCGKDEETLKTLLSALSARERLVVERISNGDTLQKIGEMLGLSRERVRQIYLLALNKLKERLLESPSPEQSSGTLPSDQIDVDLPPLVLPSFMRRMIEAPPPSGSTTGIEKDPLDTLGLCLRSSQSSKLCVRFVRNWVKSCNPMSLRVLGEKGVARARDLFRALLLSPDPTIEMCVERDVLECYRTVLLLSVEVSVMKWVSSLNKALAEIDHMQRNVHTPLPVRNPPSRLLVEGVWWGQCDLVSASEERNQ